MKTWTYDGNQVDQIMPGGFDTGMIDRDPSAYHGHVAWRASSPYGGAGIFLDGDLIYPEFTGPPSLFDGNMAFTDDGQLFFYDGDGFDLVTDIKSRNPSLYENMIVFEGYDGNDWEIFKATPASAPVPEPSTLILIGTGLVGFAVPRIRRKLKR